MFMLYRERFYISCTYPILDFMYTYTIVTLKAMFRFTPELVCHVPIGTSI